MTTEQILRDQLDRATEHVPGVPDLERAVRAGRRRRGLRRGGLAVAVVAVLGVGAAGVQTMTAGDGTTIAHEHKQGPPVAAAPAGPTDYVPGTDVDAKVAAVVAAHLPSLPAADDVYPSDSHAAGPIADAQWASAEDWQATYTENGNQVLLITGLPSEGPGCQACGNHPVPGGILGHETFSSVGDDGRTRWYFGSYFKRDDGTFANAWEIVAAEEEGAAVSQRHVTDAELEQLVQDPGLTFAALGATTP
jgi:hypothetical protein